MLERSLFVVVVCGLAVPFATQTQKPVPVKIWADKSTDVSRRVSRSGRILPFVDWTTYGLSVRDLALGEVRALAPGRQPAYPRTPTPSHDGTQIAHVLDRSLHIVPAAGGQSKVVYEHPELSGVGDWTADGVSLVVTKIADARRQEIGIVRRCDRYVSTARRQTGGVWIQHRVPTVCRVRTVDPRRARPPRASHPVVKDGRVSVLLTGADDFSPAWTPKHDAVLFVSNRDGRRGLWSIAVRDGHAAGPPRLLHELTEDLSLIGLTTDGTAYFACYGGTLTTYVARVKWPGGEVSEPTAIATPRFLGARRTPEYDPVGRHLRSPSWRPAGSGRFHRT